jgi:hypothetical protein
MNFSHVKENSSMKNKKQKEKKGLNLEKDLKHFPDSQFMKDQRKDALKSGVKAEPRK